MILPDGTLLNPTVPLVDVFVYGTLKVGRELAGGLDQYRIQSEDATCRGVMYRGKTYPMLVRSAYQVDLVYGEVHRYPLQVLDLLDMIEGYDKDNPNRSLFVREKLPVYVQGRANTYSTDMWAYLWKRPIEPHHLPIHGGEWLGEASLIIHQGEVI